ncbi:MAG: aminoglycoside 3'-phosphotransferase [Acidimicrobiia bacterium]
MTDTGPDDHRVPAAVLRRAEGRPLRLVWSNELGGCTYEVGGAHRYFVKWSPHASGIDLSKEIARLQWAVMYASVPRVIEHGADENAGWIVTEALPGESAVSDRWKQEPETAVAQIGLGLRALHDALPVDTCPFSWSVEDRIVAPRQLAALGMLDPATWAPEDRQLGVDGALALLSAPPPIDKLVVCHGDACSPNTLIADDGHWSGHVDLGDLGIAAPWADLAVATMAAEWNYGPVWQDALLDAYGIAADAERTRFYRLLWNIGDEDELRRVTGR